LNSAPADIWKAALESLQAAGRLKALCALVLDNSALSAIHPDVRAVMEAQGAAPEPTVTLPPAVPLPADVRTELYDSLTRIRAELPTTIDRHFAAVRLVRRAEIVPPDVRLKSEEEVRNASTTGCSEVVRILVTDAPTSFDRLKLTAQFTMPGGKASDAAIGHVDSADGRVFRVTLGFRGRIVPPNGKVTIRWQCIFPASVMRNEDYWVFPFVFSAPAEQMTLEAAFQRNPEDVRMFLDEADAATGKPTLTAVSLAEPRTEMVMGGAQVVVYRPESPANSGTHLFTWTLKPAGVSDSPVPPMDNEAPAPTSESPSPWPAAIAVPMSVLTRAIQAVKYALGVAGIAAAGSIAVQFFKTPGDAALATVAVFIMMVLLVAFAALAGPGARTGSSAEGSRCRPS
jgi:hypothetical protein